MAELEGSLPPLCHDMPVTMLPASPAPVLAVAPPPRAMATSYNSFSSAASVYCSPHSGFCRTNVHVVFSVCTPCCPHHHPPPTRIHLTQVTALAHHIRVRRDPPPLPSPAQTRRT